MGVVPVFSAAVAHLMVGGSVAVGANPLSATFWLSALGAFGVFVVLFAETGLLIGFFLPGDSLLFTAGLFASTGTTAPVHLSLPVVLAAAAAGALTGAQLGFVLGRRGGRALLERSHNQHLRHGTIRAQELFARYGYGKAIVLARFIPVVRTVLNPLAGILAVPTRVFVTWQVLGGLLWSLGVTLAGYGLGSTIPGIDAYLLPLIALIVVASALPVGLQLWHARRSGRADHAGQRDAGRHSAGDVGHTNAAPSATTSAEPPRCTH